MDHPNEHRIHPPQEELKAALAEKKRVVSKAIAQAADAAAEQSRLEAEVQLSAAAAAASEAAENVPVSGMAAVRGASALGLQNELVKSRLRAGVPLCPKI